MSLNPIIFFWIVIVGTTFVLRFQRWRRQVRKKADLLTFDVGPAEIAIINTAIRRERSHTIIKAIFTLMGIISLFFTGKYVWHTVTVVQVFNTAGLLVAVIILLIEAILDERDDNRLLRFLSRQRLEMEGVHEFTRDRRKQSPGERELGHD